MAQTALTQDDVRSLESTRQRLFQLTNTIASLRNNVLQSTPLPQWSTIQTQSEILAQSLKTLTGDLSKNADLLNRTVVFPSTSYPGRTQEGLLTQLLRKKLEPPVENWVDEGRAIAQDATVAKGEDEFLTWAQNWAKERVTKYVEGENGDDYTVEEREQGIENVNTGLRSDYDQDESVKSNEDEEMADVGVAVTSAKRTSLGQVEYDLGEVKKQSNANSKVRSVEEILRFATTGAIDPIPIGRR